MIDARFIAELDRTESHNGTVPMLYIYSTGDRPDGYEYAAGLYVPAIDVPVDGAYALFKTVEDAIIFAAAWFAAAEDRSVCLSPNIAHAARAMYAESNA